MITIVDHRPCSITGIRIRHSRRTDYKDFFDVTIEFDGTPTTEPKETLDIKNVSADSLKLLANNINRIVK